MMHRKAKCNKVSYVEESSHKGKCILANVLENQYVKPF